MKKQNYCEFDARDCRIECFKNFINQNNCKFVTVDISALNAFDALKFAVLSSAYHFQKFPTGKLRFKNNSADINNLIADFSLNNMEFV